MDNISVNTQSLIELAEEIYNLGGQMTIEAENMEKSVSNLNQIWVTRTGEQVTALMKKLVTEMKNSLEFVGSFSDFLQTAARLYDGTDKANNVSTFKEKCEDYSKKNTPVETAFC